MHLVFSSLSLVFLVLILSSSSVCTCVGAQVRVPETLGALVLLCMPRSRSIATILLSLRSTISPCVCVCTSICIDVSVCVCLRALRLGWEERRGGGGGEGEVAWGIEARSYNDGKRAREEEEAAEMDSLAHAPPGLLHFLVELFAEAREPPSHPSVARGNILGVARVTLVGRQTARLVRATRVAVL